MAITYPRAMPDIGIIGSAFDLQRVDYASPEAGGRIGGVTAGWPLWMMTITLRALDDDENDEWSAWIDSLRGQQRTFYGYDPKRPIPRYHAESGAAFSATAGGWSQAIDGEGVARLTLTGLLATTRLVRRDLVGFEWSDTHRTLVRVVEGGNANGSGVLTVSIEPPVQTTLVPPGAVARLDHPTCVMKLKSDETKLGNQGLAFSESGGRIVAVQDLR